MIVPSTLPKEPTITIANAFTITVVPAKPENMGLANMQAEVALVSDLAWIVLKLWQSADTAT